MAEDKPTSKSEEETPKLSKEEIEALRKVRTDFIEEQLPFLELEAKFYGLQASIAEDKYKHEIYTLKYAEMRAPAEPEEPTKSKS